MDVQQAIQIRWQDDAPSEDDLRAALLEAGAMNPAVEPPEDRGQLITFEYNEEPGFSALDVAKHAAQTLGRVESIQSR